MWDIRRKYLTIRSSFCVLRIGTVPIGHPIPLPSTDGVFFSFTNFGGRLNVICLKIKHNLVLKIDGKVFVRYDSLEHQRNNYLNFMIFKQRMIQRWLFVNVHAIKNFTIVCLQIEKLPI